MTSFTDICIYRIHCCGMDLYENLKLSIIPERHTCCELIVGRAIFSTYRMHSGPPCLNTSENLYIWRYSKKDCYLREVSTEFGIPQSSHGSFEYLKKRIFLSKLCLCCRDLFEKWLNTRYTLIARGKTVLAEKAMINGNFPTIGRVLLNKVKPTDTKMSFVYEK